MKENSTVLILLAAGNSKRFSQKIPKQYMSVGGETLFEKCLLDCMKNPNIDYILPIVSIFHHEIQREISERLSKLNLPYVELKEVPSYTNTEFPSVIFEDPKESQKPYPKLISHMFGGKERCDSVLIALDFLNFFKPKKVLIHDCARAYTPQSVITKVIANIDFGIGVVPAIPVVDTLKKVENNLIINEIDRENLFAMQTPQGFIYEEILESYKKFQDLKLTDDSSYYLKAGFKVKIIEGSELSRKITYPQDLEMLKKMQYNHEIRVGLGQDIHQFINENSKRALYLCGVKIPHNKGLKSHSDGDVVLHSLVDAILGALALGDIGDYFPPSEDKWKDKSSSIFLEFARQKILDFDGRIINIDITILAEEPKISKYKTQMKNFLAKILEIEPNRINIKATTTEKLGSIGRSEGIFASSIVSIELPCKIISNNFQIGNM